MRSTNQTRPTADETNSTRLLLIEPQILGVPADSPDVHVTGRPMIRSVYC
jgi:hypothetical protein